MAAGDSRTGRQPTDEVGQGVTVETCEKLCIKNKDSARPCDKHVESVHCAQNPNGKGKKQETKTVLEMCEADAMTMLLLTRTLSNEEYNKEVCRGAGDALDIVTNESGGEKKIDGKTNCNKMVCLQETPSKISCQLQQVKITNTLQNLTQPPQDQCAATDTETAVDVSTECEHNHERSTDPNPKNTSESSGPGGVSGSTSEPDETPPRVFPPDTGAVSADNWDFIALRRVPGQTNLGGTATSSLSQDTSQIVCALSLSNGTFMANAADADIKLNLGSICGSQGEASSVERGMEKSSSSSQQSVEQPNMYFLSTCNEDSTHNLQDTCTALTATDEEEQTAPTQAQESQENMQMTQGGDQHN